ncbi:hypothetical protein M011DRAFT_213574 [Sporormia fimetaria CBS 119925]|uniref:Uncharacterized protein n=1 Tax=Sporormia fimetaria CBS 119925 TaxID=1340428 RepID=A0A6A6V3D1_9PLEO|nr:hypothetical protein M011DRAFT_213574 [Sporormia fimetaria CBS 119925]
MTPDGSGEREGAQHYRIHSHLAPLSHHYSLLHHRQSLSLRSDGLCPSVSQLHGDQHARLSAGTFPALYLSARLAAVLFQPNGEGHSFTTIMRRGRLRSQLHHLEASSDPARELSASRRSPLGLHRAAAIGHAGPPEYDICTSVFCAASSAARGHEHPRASSTPRSKSARPSHAPGAEDVLPPHPPASDQRGVLVADDFRIPPACMLCIRTSTN